MKIEKIEELTSKEQLEFCIWLHQNFDVLVREINDGIYTEEKVEESKNEVKEDTFVEQRISGRSRRQSTPDKTKSFDQQWGRGSSPFPTVIWSGLGRDSKGS